MNWNWWVLNSTQEQPGMTTETGSTFESSESLHHQGQDKSGHLPEVSGDHLINTT